MKVGELKDMMVLMLGLDISDPKVQKSLALRVADEVRGSEIAKYVQAFGDSSRNLFAVTKIIPIEKDTTQNRYYVPLPSILGLADNKGIISVGLAYDIENDFTIVNRGMLSVYNGLEAGVYGQQYQCWPEGARLYLRNKDAKWENLRVTCLPTLIGMDDEDEIPQPYEFDDIIISGARERLQEKKVTPDGAINEDKQ